MRLSNLKQLYRILWTDRRVKVLISALLDLTQHFKANSAWRSTRARVANEISIDPDPFVVRLNSGHENPHEICIQQIIISLRGDLTTGKYHVKPGQLSQKGEDKLALMIEALWVLQKLGKLAEDVREEIEADVEGAIETWPD